MSKPNAWELEGLDALVCAIYMEADYQSWYREIFEEAYPDSEFGDETWESYAKELKIGTPDHRKRHFRLLMHF